MNKKLSMSLESYLETIAELQNKYGAVRTSDLADSMKCKRSSVTNALQRLSAKGLINYIAYRPVTLTEEGKTAIKRLDRFHSIIEDFLINVLMLPEEFSRLEACRLEHNLSKKTIEGIKHYLDWLRSEKSSLKLKKMQNEFLAFLQR
jgi:DtxR family Mn-dependent transcriptional regulator